MGTDKALVEVDGVALAGDLDCTEGYGSFPVRIDLFH